MTLLNSLGSFERYDKKREPEDPPFFDKVAWYKHKASGKDWYEFQKDIPEGYTLLKVDPHEGDFILGAYNDYSRASVEGGEMILIPRVDGDPHALMGKTLDRATGTVIDTPEPPQEVIWTPLHFKEKFTLEERKALRRFAKQDELAEDWLDLLNASTEVKPTDPRTIGGLQYMVLKGILTQQRMDAILSP